jgi:hypothetical protein
LSPILVQAALLLALAWPFALVLLLAVRATRSLAIALLPWAAAPALAVALLVPDGAVVSPATLLGSALTLDATRRVFLAATALLWLGAVWLMVGPRPMSIDGWRLALLALITMGGSFGLALASDGLLWLVSGTLAGYALYGMILQGAQRPARAAGRRLVILLVLSDLLLFELFLILAHAAGGTSFDDLRQAVAMTDSPAMILGLMAVGLGVKAGVLGAHLWLLPSFQVSTPAVRLALIAFVLAAGLSGWLNLLPLGEIEWPISGIVLQWLALATAAYALVASLLVPRPGALQGGILMALTAQWLCAVAVALQQPGLGMAIGDLIPMVGLQTGIGLAALVILLDAVKTRHRNLRLAMAWLAAVTVAVAPLPVLGAWRDAGTLAAEGLWLPSLAVAVLLGRLIAGIGTPDAEVERVPHQAHRLTLAFGLMLAALFAASTSLLGHSPTDLWSWAPGMQPGWSEGSPLPILILAVALVLGWGGARYLLRRSAPHPFMWSVDLASVREPVSLPRAHLRHLTRIRLPGWRDAVVERLLGSGAWLEWQAFARRIEARLMRWESALVMLVLLGSAAAWVAANG